MSALYNFVKVKMQDTLLTRKTNSMPLVPVNHHYWFEFYTMKSKTLRGLLRKDSAS